MRVRITAGKAILEIEQDRRHGKEVTAMGEKMVEDGVTYVAPG